MRWIRGIEKLNTEAHTCTYVRIYNKNTHCIHLRAHVIEDDEQQQQQRAYANHTNCKCLCKSNKFSKCNGNECNQHRT